MTFDEAVPGWGEFYRRIYEAWGHAGLDFWERVVFGRVVSR